MGDTAFSTEKKSLSVIEYIFLPLGAESALQTFKIKYPHFINEEAGNNVTLSKSFSEVSKRKNLFK